MPGPYSSHIFTSALPASACKVSTNSVSTTLRITFGARESMQMWHV